MRCWGVTGGSAGMISQVVALAGALGVTPEIKTVRVRAPFSWLPNICYPGLLDRLVIPYAMGKGSAKLGEPWPELVISCGRRGAIAALGLKAYLAGKSQTRFIHIQDPNIRPKHFDLVVAMEHDRIKGKNVIKTRFALHAITPKVLHQAANRFASQFARYPRPYIVVLIGGSTNKYTLTTEAMESLIVQIKQCLAYAGALLITPSRRTGEENVALLKEAFLGNPRVYIYDGVTDNPYFGLLALADAIVVTDDSVNMMSEAHATGKPIYLLALPGHTGTKPARFSQKLVKDGIARPVCATLEPWNYPKSDEMERLAAEVKRRLSLP